MKIDIQTIPHSEQRYQTAGDWYWAIEMGEVILRIRVSRLASHKHQYLLAIHELIEALLCHAASISEDEVDEWDMDYVNKKVLSGRTVNPLPLEPGDHPAAPYYRQHRIATAIELLCAAEMEVYWGEYEKAVDSLG